MRHILWARRPVPTEEAHRVTPFEVFFDLVFVFAFIRVVAFMVQQPMPLGLARGLILLLLLWWPFSTYAWLTNQVRADVGLVRAGMSVVMAAMFVAALVLPAAWRDGTQTIAAPLTLALAYIVVRAVFLALSWHISAGNPRLRAQVLILAIPIALGSVPLLLGAVLGDATQTLLWAAAFLIEYVGGLFVAVFRGRAFPLPSPSHLAERHGLAIIIALGESLVSVGTGAGSAVTRWPVLIGALLALTTALGLWWLYFENTAAPAGRALALTAEPGRANMGAAYGFTHFLLIAGVIYLALGIDQVLAELAHHPPGQPTGTRLDWTSTAALFGGVALYLVGRALFLHLTVRHTPPVQLVAVGAVLVLLPIARVLPALAALGLITAVLVALVGYERITWQPSAAAK